MDSVTEAIDQSAMQAQTRVGTTLRGKWHLDRLLGVGGMAAVYAASHRNGTRAAVKVLHHEYSSHRQVRARFLKEGYLANRVNHPGVVRVLDDDQADDGSLFIVMELLDGESLQERAKRLGGRLEVDEVLSASDQLLDVLAAAHDQGIIHRDIKPENVFLTRDGVIKVLDFGIARMLELSGGSQATRAGTTLGTPAFMAPEHARGLWDEVDARTDLWSVGALMYSLIIGRPVHEGRTTNEILLAAMSKPARSMHEERGVPDEVASLVDRALAYARAERWPDARAMQNAVRQAFHRAHGAPLSSHPKLIVPASVPNRTLATADDPDPAVASLGRAGQVVASGSTGAPLTPSTAGAQRRDKLLVVGAVGGLAVVSLATALVAVVLSRGNAASGAISPSVLAADPTPPTSVSASTLEPAPSASSDPPLTSFEELPASPQAHVRPVAPSTKPDAGARAGSPAAKRGDWKDQRH
ncbi:MAG: protein kinase [Myxococcales bacterium]|nr:protein kinase [Myxococcales bacterium]